MARWAADRLVAEIERLAARGLSAHEFLGQTGERLRRSVAADAICWATLDPDTLLMTSVVAQDLVANGVVPEDAVAAAGWQLLRSEYVVEDVNTAAGLAGRRAPVGILSHATRGHPERSERYRRLLVPHGVPFELRGTLTSRGRAWACVALHRREGRGDFSSQDAALLAGVARPVADGLRASLRADAARCGDQPHAPGLVVLGPHDDVELLTPAAVELFAELIEPRGRRSREELPVAVLALAAATRRQAGARAHVDAEGLTLPSRHGWVTLHASLPDGTRSKRVAIIVERARSERVASLRLLAYGLTARERDIAALIVAGMSTRDIAARLFISPHTVQDHLKSIFEKTDTRTRRELVARVFFTEYLPRIEAAMPTGAPRGEERTARSAPAT